MKGEGKIIIITMENDFHQLLQGCYMEITAEKCKTLADWPADRAWIKGLVFKSGTCSCVKPRGSDGSPIVQHKAQFIYTECVLGISTPINWRGWELTNGGETFPASPVKTSKASWLILSMHSNILAELYTLIS